MTKINSQEGFGQEDESTARQEKVITLEAEFESKVNRVIEVTVDRGNVDTVAMKRQAMQTRGTQ